MTEPTERRTDINTRKVIEVLDAKLEEKLRGVVFWERLTVILGVAAVVIITGAWVVTTMASSRAEARASSAESSVANLRKDTGEAIQLLREENREGRTDIRALSKEFRTGKAQPRLTAPVPALPPNPITAEEN
jgi:cytoskeletal protein RodZ